MLCRPVEASKHHKRMAQAVTGGDFSVRCSFFVEFCGSIRRQKRKASAYKNSAIVFGNIIVPHFLSMWSVFASFFRPEAYRNGFQRIKRPIEICDVRFSFPIPVNGEGKLDVEIAC